MSYSSYILSLSPSAYWRLGDTGTTTAADASGNGRAGTYSGSYTQGVLGSIGGDTDTAVYFTGGHIDVPHDAAINTSSSFTYLMRIKALSSDPAGSSLIATTWASGSHRGVWMDLSNSAGIVTYEMLVYDATGNVSQSGVTNHYSANTWHTLAFVYDSGASHILVYVDGTLDPNFPLSLTTAYSPGGNDLWIAAANGFAYGTTTNLILDEVAYFAGTALTGGQVSTAHTDAGTPPTGAPVATISGSTVNVEATSLDVNQQVGQRGTGSVRVWSGLGVRWTYGTAVQIRDGTGAVVYNGYVTKDKATRGSYQGNGYLEHDLKLTDNAYRADKRLITASYLNQTADFIFTDLVTTYLAAEGVSISGSVAAGILIPQKSWVLEKTSSAFDWLAEQCGFWWSIDSNGVAWFQPYSGRPSGVVIDGSTLSADDTLSVSFGNDQFVTKQWVKGANAETPLRTEYFAGDGTRQAFTLAYEVSSLQSIVLNGVAQSVGTKTVDSGKQWYFAVGDAVIAQDQSGARLGPGDSLAVSYKGRYPIIAAAYNPTLIAAQAVLEGGGTGIVESVLTDTKLYNQDAALAVATNMLAKYGADLILLEAQTKTNPGFIPGQSFTATLSDWGLSSHTFLCTYFGITDAPTGGAGIWYHVQAVGSPYEPAQHQQFWRKLMSQRPDPDVIAANVVSIAVVLNALEADSVLSVKGTVREPSAPMVAGAILKGP